MCQIQFINNANRFPHCSWPRTGTLSGDSELDGSSLNPFSGLISLCEMIFECLGAVLGGQNPGPMMLRDGGHVSGPDGHDFSLSDGVARVDGVEVCGNSIQDVDGNVIHFDERQLELVDEDGNHYFADRSHESLGFEKLIRGNPEDFNRSPGASGILRIKDGQVVSYEPPKNRGPLVAGPDRATSQPSPGWLSYTQAGPRAA